MDLDSLTYDELVALRERVNSRIAKLRAAATEDLVDRVRRELLALGVSTDELAERLKGQRRGGRGRRSRKPAAGALAVPGAAA